MPAVDEVRALLDGFNPGSDGDAAHSCRMARELLANTPSPFSRFQYQPGHLTASGIVLSPDGRSVLLVYHRRLAKWLQPGGHIEAGDATLIVAAQREILEETGVTMDHRVSAVVVGVDVHQIPPGRGEPAHHHHDIAFRFAAASMVLPGTAERNQVVWCPLEELQRYVVDGPLRRSVARATAWWERAAAAGPRNAEGASG